MYQSAFVSDVHVKKGNENYVNSLPQRNIIMYHITAILLAVVAEVAKCYI